jgi:Putative transposase DNA-binding domain
MTVVVDTGALQKGRLRALKASESATTTPQGEEDTPRTLAKRPDTGQSLTTAQAGEVPVSSTATIDIVRATTKFQVDIRGCKLRCGNCTECTNRILLFKMLDDVDKLCTTARNAAIRALVKRDGEALDNYLAEHGEMPKKAADWLPIAIPGKPAGYAYSYPLMTRVVPRLSTNIVANLQRKTDSEWRTDRYEVLIRQTRSARHYKLGAPIPLPSAAIKFVSEGHGLRASFALYSTKHDGERHLSLLLDPKDARQRDECAKLGSGEWRAGETTIMRDRLRPSRWYVRIAYTRTVAKQTNGIDAAITRGMRCFLVAALASQETWFYDGEDIEATLKQFQRRRKEYQYASKASGRWGHGRTRTLMPTKHLEAKADRWRETRLAVIASRLAHWLAERKVTRVFIEDFSGVRDVPPEMLETAKGDETKGQWIWDHVQEWPYYRQALALSSALDALGIAVIQIPKSPTTKTCCKCGHVDEASRNLGTWKFKCTKCRWFRHLDVAQALTTLNIGASGDATKMTAFNESAKLDMNESDAKATSRKPLRKGVKGHDDSQNRSK